MRSPCHASGWHIPSQPALPSVSAALIIRGGSWSWPPAYPCPSPAIPSGPWRPKKCSAAAAPAARAAPRCAWPGAHLPQWQRGGSGTVAGIAGTETSIAGLQGQVAAQQLHPTGELGAACRCQRPNWGLARTPLHKVRWDNNKPVSLLPWPPACLTRAPPALHNGPRTSGLTKLRPCLVQPPVAQCGGVAQRV